MNRIFKITIIETLNFYLTKNYNITMLGEWGKGAKHKRCVCGGGEGRDERDTILTFLSIPFDLKSLNMKKEKEHTILFRYMEIIERIS